jgi:hypothetical protein
MTRHLWYAPERLPEKHGGCGWFLAVILGAVGALLVAAWARGEERPPDPYQTGLHVRNDRTISWNGWNDSFPRLGAINLNGVHAKTPIVRIAHAYGAALEPITARNSTLEAPAEAIVEIVDSINTDCPKIYCQDNNNLAVRMVGMSGVNPEYPKHWLSQQRLSIVSQGNRKNLELKYVEKSDLWVYVEAGLHTQEKTTVRQCADNRFYWNGFSDLDVDAYSAGLNRWPDEPLAKGRVIPRTGEPFVNAPPNVDPFAVVMTAGDSICVVKTSWYENASIDLDLGLMSMTPKPGDGMEVTADISIELPRPSHGLTLGYVKLFSGQEHDGQQDLTVPEGKRQWSGRLRIIGGWEAEGQTAPRILLAAFDRMPNGTRIRIEGLVVKLFEQ